MLSTLRGLPPRSATRRANPAHTFDYIKDGRAVPVFSRPSLFSVMHRRAMRLALSCCGARMALALAAASALFIACVLLLSVARLDGLGALDADDQDEADDGGAAAPASAPSAVDAPRACNASLAAVLDAQIADAHGRACAATPGADVDCCAASAPLVNCSAHCAARSERYRCCDSGAACAACCAQDHGAAMFAYCAGACRATAPHFCARTTVALAAGGRKHHHAKSKSGEHRASR